VQTSVTFL